MKIISIMVLVWCLKVTVQHNRTLNTTNLEQKYGFLHTVYFSIHNVTNELLLILKTDKNFTLSDSFQKLLTMHSYFKSLSEGNYFVYERLKLINYTDSNKNDKKLLKDLLLDAAKNEIDIISDNCINLVNDTYFKETETTNNNTKFKENENMHFYRDCQNFKNKTIETIIESVINDNIVSNLSKLSNETRKRHKHNETENPGGIFYEILLKLSDETIESLLNSMARKPKNISTNIKPTELKTWYPEKKINRTRRIYKGKKTRIKNYPFVASLHLMNEFLCSGSIISSNMVLTAASCLQLAQKSKHYHKNTKVILVRMGSDKTKRFGKLIPIVEIIFHPNFNSVTLKNNLAIARMLKKLKHMKTRKIKKIKFDRNPSPLPKNAKEVTILGWGAKNAKDKAKGLQRLTISHVDIYNTRDCRKIYSKYYVTDTNFCAGFSSKGGGACVGDVGGPAVVAKELVGIVSFGPTVCGLHDAPTVFTKLGYYAEWIEAVINEKFSDESNKSLSMEVTTFEPSSMLPIPLHTIRKDKEVKENREYKEDNEDKDDKEDKVDKESQESIEGKEESVTKETEFVTKHTTPIYLPPQRTGTSTDPTTSKLTTKTLNPITERFETLKPEDPEEIQILKKLVSDFILGNNTVIDYLTNVELDEYDDSNEKLFTEPKKSLMPYSGPKSLRDNEFKCEKPTCNNSFREKLNTNVSRLLEYLRKHPKKNTFQTKSTFATSITETTPYFLNDGVPQSTKMGFFVESAEFPEDTPSLDEDASLKSSSSYYEDEISIEIGSFQPKSTDEKKNTQNDTHIDLDDFVKILAGQAKLWTEKSKRKNVDTEDDLFNIYHKPYYVDKIPEPKYSKQELYKIYNMMNWLPSINDHHKNVRKTNTGEKDMVIHFVNDKLFEKKHVVDDDDDAREVTSAAHTEKTWALSSEDGEDLTR